MPLDVCFWPKAAAPAGDCRVRFRGYSCRDAGRVAWQLMTQLRHWRPVFLRCMMLHDTVLARSSRSDDQTHIDAPAGPLRTFGKAR